MLLPVRSGHLLLPNVEVKPLIPEQPSALTFGSKAASTPRTPGDPRLSSTLSPGSDLSWQTPRDRAHPDLRREQDLFGSQLTCATDYRSHAQTILVLPDAKSTTVNIDLDHPASGVQLMETESRLDALSG